MDFLIPFLIGIGLSMDCFAVSLAIGSSTKTNLQSAALIIALSFGVFQTGMTLAGWIAGSGLIGLIAGFDHWVAFALLLFIGLKMIIEGLKGEIDETNQVGILEFAPVIVLSIATSIDALAVGVSFAVLQLGILVPSLIIGIIAFLFSFVGVLLGTRLVSLLGKKIEVFGGLILIAIGLRILLEHYAVI